MNEVFDDDEPQPEYEPLPVERPRDTELTLGPLMLLGLFFGLVLLCGLCFGLGYAMGSHGAHDSSTPGQPGVSSGVMAASSQPKPAAAPPYIPPPASGFSPSEAATADAQNPGSPSAGVNSAQPLIKPALPVAATAPAPAAAALAPASALMVQIATVSQKEDAEVLVEALRKRGYAVTVHRDAADSQFHVRIGPFTSRGDANAMRQKLLNDGYNAIVQP
jgi:cell division septation protein DedD